MDFELTDFGWNASNNDNTRRKIYVAVVCALALTLVSAICFACSAVSNASNEVDFSFENNADASTDAPAERKVTVHVSGAVRAPGVYELEEGRRVADAVEAAGGMNEQASEESLNLARQLVDGEHIVVKTNDEMNGQKDDSKDSAIGKGMLVSINDSSASMLQELPGIGPAMADKIVAYREKNGPFRRITDLMNVSGIGQARFDALSDLICL